MDVLPASLLDRPVAGVGVAPGTLRDQLGERPTLLVFLRHFGCIFCKEQVSDLRAAAEASDRYPDVLFFTQGSAQESRAFLRTYWPSARAISDPELAFYDALGARRAGVLEAFGPKVFVGARRRARAKGHENGPVSGDLWRMPAILLVVGERIVWRFEPTHVADRPDFSKIQSLLDSASSIGR